VQTAPQRGLGRGGEAPDLRRDAADRHRDRGVGVEAVELGGDVELHELARAQSPGARDAVHRLVVDADADRPREPVDERGGGAGAVAGEHLRGMGVELGGGDARAHAPGHLPQRRRDSPPGATQRGELLRGVDRHERDPNTG
jgi:hypothetical protein